MRIFTTTLLLTCAVFFGSAIKGLAQPVYTIINTIHACGGNPNGSFVVNVTSATGFVELHVFGPGGYQFEPPRVNNPSLPFQILVPNTPGRANGGTWSIVVIDADDPTPDLSAKVFDFTVTPPVIVDNTDCVTPNGSINVNLTGSSPAGPITYQWVGPGGPYVTQDLTSISGGNYFLTYTDGTVTSCSLPVAHVNDPAPPSFTISSADPDICEGETLIVDVNGVTDAAWTYDLMDGATILDSKVGTGGSIQLTTAALTPNSYTLRVRASAGSCAPHFNDPADLAATVSAKPVGANANITRCSDEVVNFMLASNPIPIVAATFDIAVNPNGLTQSSGTPSAGVDKLAAEIADDVWTNTGLAFVDVVYTITPVSAAPAKCAGNPFLLTVRVNPEPVGANSAVTRCTDTAVGVMLTTSPGSVAASTYNIATNANGLTQVGGTVSAGSAKAANELMDDIWRNTGLNTVDVVYTITPVSADNCAGDPFTVTVSVDPGPVGTNAAIAVCSQIPVGFTLVTDPGSVVASTYTIVVTPNGLTQSAGTPSAGSGKADNEIADDVWLNTGLLPVDVTYDVTPVSAALCAGDPFTITVTVNPEPVGSNASTAVCTDQPTGVTLTTNAGSVAAASYTIAVNANGLTQVGGTDSNGAGKAANEIVDDVWTNIGSGPVDVVYTVTPVSADNCAGNNFTVTVTVNAEPFGISQNVTICSDALVGIPLGVAGGSVAAAAYDIVVNSNGLVFSGTTPSNGNGKPANELMDDRWTNPGLAPVDVVYTITPVSAAPCPGDPFVITVTIDPEPLGTNSAVTICSDVLVNVDLTGSVSGVATTGFDIVANANGLTFSGTTPSAGPGKLANEIIDDAWTNTGLLPVDVVYTIVPRTAANCGGDPFTITVHVNPEPVGAPAGTTVCSDQAVGFTLTTSGASVATQSYNIAVNSNGMLLVGGTASAGTGKADNELADDVWNNSTNGPVDVIYTIVPVSAAGCVGDPFDITVTVNPEPVGADDSRTICNNTNVAYDLQTANIDVLGNGLGATAFSWVATPNPNVTNESSGTTVSITDVLINTTSVDQSVVYTVTPTSSLGCPGSAFLVTIVVTPEPVLLFPQGADVCSGTAAGYEIKMNPANLPAGTTFTWGPPVMSDATSQGSPSPGPVAIGTPGTIHINDILTNLATGPITATYMVTPALGACVGAARPVVLTIHQAPTAEAGANQVLCTDNGDYLLAGSSVGGAATMHTWSFVSQPGSGTITPSPDPLDPAQAKFFATTPGDYVLRIATDATTACSAAIDLVTITVSDKPVVAAGQVEFICSGDAVDYEILMTSPTLPPTTLLSWPDPDGPGPAQAGSVNLGPSGTIHLNDVLFNNGAVDIPVDYVITPSIGLCVGSPVTVRINVRPAPVVAFNQSKTICSGDRVDYEILLNPLNTPAGTTFSWPDPDGAGPGTSKLDIAADPLGTIHITDQLFNGTGAAMPPVVYQVVAKGANGCRAVPRDVRIFVNPGAVAEAGAPQAICANGTANLAGSSIGGLATMGTWTIQSTPVGGGTASITQSPDPADPDQASFTASVAGDYTLRLTTDPGGACPAVFDEVVITVRSPGDPSCTGGTGTCPSSVIPVPTNATCNNSDGSVFFNISPPTPITGDVRITIDRFVPATPPESRTNFASVDGFTFVSLPAGEYNYEVEYGGPACIKTGTFTINRSGTVGDVFATNPVDPSCFGDTGAALIYADNQAGITLEWSLDGVLWTPFLDSTVVSGLPSGSNLISVRRPGDACAAGFILTLANPTEITAGLVPVDATCFNNDGSISVSNLTGGTGPYTFTLNGVAINLPANNIIPGLTANTYDLIITDSRGCSSASNPVIVSFPGFVNHTAPVITSPDCAGSGANGKVEFNISDPGSFQFALTTDLVAEPATYNPLGGSLVSVSNLTNGDYAIWLKPMGAGTKCATKVPVTINGVYSVSYTATTSDVVCFAAPTSIVLSNISGAPGLPFGFTLTNTADNSVTTGTITASQALSTFAINSVTPGNYSVLLTQNQSSIVPACTTPVNGGVKALVVNGPDAALDSLYVKRAISFPDLPSGSALVGVSPSGLEPYETRLELTTPLFAAQEFVSDWTQVNVNPQNLKFERSYTNLYAGVYTLGIRDAGGCERSYVFTLRADTNLFIPNMFSPNGDGHNEVFYIRNLPADSKLLITNRWGKEVFKSSSYTNDWNGGDTVDGLYFYTLTTGSQSINGWVEIMRGQ